MTDSPTTRYPIRFTTPGTYTIWSRTNAPNAAGDSLYVDLNGQLVSVTGGGPGEWDWANRQTPGGETASLSIETTGLLTLTTLMREDGLRLDRLLLTTDTTYIPTGDGPPETERQVGASTETTSITRTIVYTYDDLYRLTGAGYSTGETFAYAYDPLGNQTAITETIETTIVTTYTYNGANQRVTARADDDNITWYYTHDANGNLTRQTPGGTTAAEGEIRYSYDAADRLVEVELYTGGSYTILSEAAYNGNGERVRLTSYAQGISQTVSYVLVHATRSQPDQGQVLVADDGSSETLYLHAQTMLAEYEGDWSYPLRDSSSLRQTVNQSGTVTLARSYTPFGGTLTESGAYESSFGFAGAQLDRVSGLLYANGRYYDPATGRYLTPNHSFDPLRPGTLNPYAPLQGPGLWLLLPFVGLVLLRKRRNGPWRILVLVCVVGTGMLLTSCGGEPIIEVVPVEGTPTQTPIPQPPTVPTSSPTSTQTATPTDAPTSTPPPLPTSTATSTPLPPTPTVIPCPTPSVTPTPEIEWLDGEFKITHYTFALESDPIYENDETVSANGLNEEYREGFLFGPQGILLQGTGLAENGEYITIDWGQGIPQGRDTYFTYGIGGKGGQPMAWETAAANDSRLPLGTQIIIEIYEDQGAFTVNDSGSGVQAGQIDIFVGAITIEEAKQYGTRSSRVGIVRE